MPTPTQKVRLMAHMPVICAICVSLSAPVALACSTVALGGKDQVLLAYSYDLAETGAGFLMINPPELHRHSIMEDNPAQWIAHHGSVTFNQLGPGMPAAGMNTNGLVVTLMWNEGAVYPRAGAHDVVNELEFIQRILDLAGSVDEALSLMGDVEIDGLVPIHFFLADRVGDMAALSPTSEGFVTYSDKALPVPALTNDDYADLMSELSTFETFGGARALPAPDQAAGPSSLERFVISAVASRQLQTGVSYDKAFDVLDSLENPYTRWQIVFDPIEGTIEYRTAGADTVHHVDLATIDFNCGTAPLATSLEVSAADPSSVAFHPLETDDLAPVLGEVLSALSSTTGLGPEIAPGLAAAQLGLHRCTD